MSNTYCPEQVEDRGPFITTNSGVPFFVKDCNVADVPLGDIAHSLALSCRFNGHIRCHYSVAEHSVLVSRLVELDGGSVEEQLMALFHDASEAFLPDLPRPFKHLVPAFGEYEERILQNLFEELDLPYPLTERINYFDSHIVRFEAAALYPYPPEWIKAYDDLSDQMRKVIDHFIGVSPAVARVMFTNRLARLNARRGRSEEKEMASGS